MRAPRLGTLARLAALLGGGLGALAAWSLYQNPALGVMLGMMRFCG